MKISGIFSKLVEQSKPEDSFQKPQGDVSSIKDTLKTYENPYDLDLDIMTKDQQPKKVDSHSCTCNYTCDGCNPTDNCGVSHYCATNNRCGHSESC